MEEPLTSRSSASRRSAATSDPGHREPEATAGTATVLVVHDAPAKRKRIAGRLRRAGYRTVEAATGAEALLRLDDAVDLVVLYEKLPDLTGAALCRRMKAVPGHATLPVIHLSTLAEPAAERGGEAADAYLVEPVDPDELLATVQTLLRYHLLLWQADRLARRLARLARTTLELNTAKTLRELLRTAARGASAIFESPAVVCAETPDGHRLAATSTGPGGEIAVQPCAAEPFEVPVGSVLREQPATEWAAAGWRDDRSLLVVGARLRPDRSPVYVGVPAVLTDEGAPVLTQLGQAVAVAIDVTRAYQEEHRLALTLQRSLLPTRLPALPGYDVAVRYVPASEQAEIGGDFYEVSVLDGQFAVGVGDVNGHSLHAATVMAELRHGTRAYLAEGHGPGAVLDRLNRLLLRLIPDEMATLCLLLVDPATGRSRYANAGHPPPLVAVDGRVDFVTRRSALLGLRGAEPTAEFELAIPRGATLVLFTDGLVERRGRHIDTGLAELAAAAGHVEDDLDEFCDRLLAEVGPDDPEDDIAVLALRRHAG